jgi:hypothetical protein
MAKKRTPKEPGLIRTLASKEVRPYLEKFVDKVNMSALAGGTALMSPVLAIRDADGLRTAGNVLKPAADYIAAHPYGAPVAALAAGALAGTVGAFAHQAGLAKGRREHLEDAANQARR